MLAGDEAAFEAFGERYPRAVYRFAASRLGGDAELTRDIVQTTLCKALARLDTYRGDAALLTWLCACCRNEILMHLRRRASRPRELAIDRADGRLDDRLALEGPPPAPGPEGALLRHEERLRVHLALDLLPEHYARALEWKYLDRLPVKEIAQRLELAPKAAESLLTRARRAFRDGYTELAAAGAGPRPVAVLEDLGHG
jgi:RNA polymerase sigma-70 factor (ECF subfamily)